MTYANGTATFYSSAPIATLADIPKGTIISTKTGLQFETTVDVVMPHGSKRVDVPIRAERSGPSGNVPARAINFIVSGLMYPLRVINHAPTSGG